MFKSLTEKHCTINHMIFFNDSISKFYQCSTWGFCRGISMFFSICLRKNNAEVINFLRIFKKCSENKIDFCSRKKSNVSFHVSLFIFHAIFKLAFITQIIYRIIHRCLCSHFIVFLLSYISQEKEHRNNINLSLFIKLVKVSTTKWTKKEASSTRVWTLNM